MVNGPIKLATDPQRLTLEIQSAKYWGCLLRLTGSLFVYNQIAMVMPLPNEDPEAMAEARAAALEEILTSDSDRKVIIGGPGTGKTYTFQQLVDQLPEDSDIQVLTFINLLVEDLREDLPDRVDVNTFHSYCRGYLHRTAPANLGPNFDYFPGFSSLVIRDMDYAYDMDLAAEDLKKTFHILDRDSGILSRAIEIGNYYAAMSFDDSVYRAVDHMESNPSDIPEHDLVIVDEYQDFNRLETEFLELLNQENPIVMAGDDDQALYGPLRKSSPDHLRERHREGHTESFELPYCSRCPEPIVDAVNLAVEQAQERGHLGGRIDKNFICYTPEKEGDSERHPEILHARCSVERNNAPYMGKYVLEQINQIPSEYIEASRSNGRPTALVIGPNPFRENVYEVLDGALGGVQLSHSPGLDISLIDGLRRIAGEPESRLGWRIVLYCDSPDEVDEIVREALTSDTDLVDFLPPSYVQKYRDLADIVDRIDQNLPVDDGEREELAEEAGTSPEDLEQIIRVDAESPQTPSLGEGVPEGEPTVLCTSLVGSKGLSAELVFLVGMNNGHVPRESTNPSNQMIHCFLVGLSRTRRECHLVSCKMFGSTYLDSSVFIDWIGPCVRQIQVNKDYFES